jgi:hypothetical protein
MKTLDQRSPVLDTVMDGLMRRYRERTPDVERVVRAMMAEGLVARADEIERLRETKKPA